MSRRSAYELNEGKGRKVWRSLEEKNADPLAINKEAEAEKPGGFWGWREPDRCIVFVVAESSILAEGLDTCSRCSRRFGLHSTTGRKHLPVQPRS